MQLAARLMRRHGSGSIINISSIMGVHGNAGEVVYAGAKAAVIGATKSAAKELAPVGIRVNAIAPGFIDTDLTRALTPALFEERLASIGMGRVGQPQDVANVVLFLASDLVGLRHRSGHRRRRIDGRMTFLGLQPSGRQRRSTRPAASRCPIAELIARAGVIAGHLGQDKQLVFLLSRNDMFSSTVYAGTQLAGHAVAMLDGSRPLAGHVDLAEYRPAWIGGPGGHGRRARRLRPRRAQVTSSFGGELIAMAERAKRTSIPTWP